MASKAKNGLAPRVESSADVYGRKLGNRARAMLDSVFDMLDADHAAGRFDPRVALRKAYEADPLGYLERVVKMTPEAQAPAQGVLNVNNLYHLAVQQAQPVTIEHEAHAGGYIEGTATDKPLIPQEEW